MSERIDQPDKRQPKWDFDKKVALAETLAENMMLSTDSDVERRLLAVNKVSDLLDTIVSSQFFSEDHLYVITIYLEHLSNNEYEFNPVEIKMLCGRITSILKKLIDILQFELIRSVVRDLAVDSHWENLDLLRMIAEFDESHPRGVLASQLELLETEVNMRLGSAESSELSFEEVQSLIKNALGPEGIVSHNFVLANIQNLEEITTIFDCGIEVLHKYKRNADEIKTLFSRFKQGFLHWYPDIIE